MSETPSPHRSTRTSVRGHALQRKPLTVRRESEFFTERELNQQIGFAKSGWPLALFKELVDNALDACEQAGVQPVVEVEVADDWITVQDNGSGLDEATLRKAADYGVRVSDKAFYASPTRGQLGNAFKCVLAAPYVATGKSQVDVETRGRHHRIAIRFDAVAQEPHVEVESSDGGRTTGTKIRMDWNGVGPLLASSERRAKSSIFVDRVTGLADLVAEFSLMNPNARFTLCFPDAPVSLFEPRCDETWTKWLPTNPTSPWWYDGDSFRALIAARLREERGVGRAALTIRDFAGEFRGLSSVQMRKRVLADCGLSGLRLADLVCGDAIDGRADELLSAMKAASRPVAPDLLGCLGEANMQNGLTRLFDACDDTFRYRKTTGTRTLGERSLPFVVEVAFARLPDADAGRKVISSLNFSPSLRSFEGLDAVLGEQRVDPCDPVVILVHVTTPAVPIVDRGKSVVDLRSDPSLLAAIEEALRKVTRDWQRAKKAADRDGRMHERDLRRLARQSQQSEISIKTAAYAIIPRAYALASDNGELPANARQVMYAARPLVMESSGGRCWENDNYFTQTLLPDYLNDHPAETAAWDIVYDDRGHFAEPHTRRRIGLGTLGVRDYTAVWHAGDHPIQLPVFDYRAQTSGPTHRFKSVLFIEKEGFQPLLDRARFSERFDMAVMSTKGMSVTASRALVESLSLEGCTIFVLHDFDKSGLSILATLGRDTRRYTFRNRPNIVDLGLRLDDVVALGLTPEPVTYDRSDPRPNLRTNGATPEEISFLCNREVGAVRTGQRVELNALTSRRFVDWLESKLGAEGATKLVPDTPTLDSAYRDATLLDVARAGAEQAAAGFDAGAVRVPSNLAALVQTWLRDHPEDAWDEAVASLASERELLPPGE